VTYPPRGRGDLAWQLSSLVRSIDGQLEHRLLRLGHDDVRPGHLALLLNLERAGARGSELARLAGITKQSMGELVRELERLDYVERRPDPRDGRARLVQPTGRGLILIAHLRQAMTEIEADAARRLGHERFTELRRALADLAAETVTVVPSTDLLAEGDEATEPRPVPVSTRATTRR
jgi:DNA-binding MarR family transcriptional regulator